MDISTFIARHCFEKNHLGAGVFLHTGYLMDAPSTMKLPPGFREQQDWSQGGRRVFVSKPDRAILTMVDSDITIVRYQDEEAFNHAIAEQSEYYHTTKRADRRRGGLSFQHRHGACIL